MEMIAVEPVGFRSQDCPERTASRAPHLPQLRAIVARDHEVDSLMQRLVREMEAAP